MKYQNFKFIFALIILGGILFNSCRKDKLTNEREILAGKWNWFLSVTGPDNGSSVKYIQERPSNPEITFSIEFLKKGVLYFYDGDQKKDSKRLIFLDEDHNSNIGNYVFTIVDTWTLTDSGMVHIKTDYTIRDAYWFSFCFNKLNNEQYHICVNHDTIVNYFYPKSPDPNYTHSLGTTNFFVRE